MLQLNYKLSATEALQFQLVSKVYKKSELDSILWPQIREQSKLSKESICITKKLISNFQLKDLERACDRELEELYKRFESDDFMNAVANFMQRKQSKSKL